MRTANLVRIFCTDHFRSGIVLSEAVITALFAYTFLDIDKAPYAWPYLVMCFTIMGIVMSALITILLSWRNSDPKTEHLILKAGRVRCYFAMLISSIAITVFWLLIIAFYIGVFLLDLSQPIAIYSAVPIIASILLVVATLFLLFSSFIGKKNEILLAIILVILGLNSFYFLKFGDPWSKIIFLFPPLIENIHAVTEDGLDAPFIRTSIYFVVLISTGLLRLKRKEFIHS